MALPPDEFLHERLHDCNLPILADASLDFPYAAQQQKTL
jgi:hypothetical protein